jgi:hypothetical protein
MGRGRHQQSSGNNFSGFSLALVHRWRGWRGWAVGLVFRCQVLALAVGVSAGLLLSGLVVCVRRMFSLSLLATARGGASFLFPKRKRNEAKKTL